MIIHNIHFNICSTCYFWEYSFQTTQSGRIYCYSVAAERVGECLQRD